MPSAFLKTCVVTVLAVQQLFLRLPWHGGYGHMNHNCGKHWPTCRCCIQISRSKSWPLSSPLLCEVVWSPVPLGIAWETSSYMYACSVKSSSLNHLNDEATEVGSALCVLVPQSFTDSTCVHGSRTQCGHIQGSHVPPAELYRQRMSGAESWPCLREAEALLPRCRGNPSEGEDRRNPFPLFNTS